MLPLCNELLATVTEFPNNSDVKLSFTPNQPGIDSRYYTDADKEIICFKKTYLLIFKEAHDYFSSIDSGM